MSKKNILIIIAVAVLVGIAGGYVVWRQYQIKSQGVEPVIEEAGEAAEKITATAMRGILPSLDVINPLENKPNVNPVDQTNPFKDIKTNPFD